jgi:RND family efflux transporter MFP subunit
MRPLPFLAPLALALLAGCNQHPPAAQPPAAAGPASFPTVHPKKQSVARWVEQPGAVFAFEEAPLVAKVTGYVTAVADDPDKKDRPPHDRKIDTGSKVKAGQPLATIAVPELADEARQKAAAVEQAAKEAELARQAVQVAAAEVAVARAAVGEAKAGVKRAEADVVRWTSESARLEKLAAGGVADEQNRDEARRQKAAAEAARDEATARVAAAEATVRKWEAQERKAKADVGAAEAKVAVAAADAARLQSLLGYTQVKAPFDGVVTRRAVDPGHLVRPERGDPLFVVARLDVVRVRVEVPEADAALVAPGAEARLDVPAAGGPVTGTVARVSWSLEPAARTLRAEVDLPNPDRKYLPGMYVAAKIAVPQPATWTLPATAVVKQGEQTVCFLVKDGKAVRTVVRAGRSDGKLTEVPKRLGPSEADWTGDEVVVAENVAGLADGQPINVSAAGK